MGQLKTVLAAGSCLVLAIGLAGCGGSNNSGVSAPPVGSGNVQFAAQASFSGPGTGAGQFTYPAGITIAPNGNIVVCDFGNGRVEVFTSSGNYVGQIGTEGTAPGDLESPADVAISNGNYFVTDPAANAVVEYNSNFTFVQNLTAPNGFFKPTGITVDPSGNIFVGESGAILEFNSAGVYQQTITSIGGTPLPSLIVAGLAADQNGNLLALDPASQSTIDNFTPSGTILTKIPVTGDPYSIATDGRGNVFFSDLTNHDILMYAISTGTEQSAVVTSINSQGLAVNNVDTLVTSVATSPGGYVAVYRDASSPTGSKVNR